MVDFHHTIYYMIAYTKGGHLDCPLPGKQRPVTDRVMNSVFPLYTSDLMTDRFIRAHHAVLPVEMSRFRLYEQLRR